MEALSIFGPDPVFMKPRVSRGSRGISLFSNYKEIPTELIEIGNIFCEYLPGHEFTTDVLCDLRGVPTLIVPRKRLNVRRGTSLRGETQRRSDIQENVKNICSSLGFIGPVNIQFKEDSCGRMKLVEVNPRFSGGLYITAQAGANAAEILCRMLENEPIPKDIQWVESTFDNKMIEMKYMNVT
jgi:carbamoyl-phosphate synthase large subunit